MKNSTQTIRWRYLSMEMILILAGSYLLLIASTKIDQIRPAILLINAVLLTAAAIFLIVKSRKATGVELPVGIMMGVMLLASLTSIDPRRSLGEFGLVAIPITLFFVVAELVNRRLSRELIVKALLVVGAVFMVLSWTEAVNWYLAWIKANPGDWIPFINYRLDNPNLLAMVFNVWLMLAIARLITSQNKSERLILGIWIVSALGIIFFTSSRGGWLGTAAGLACLAFIYLRMKRSQWLPWWERLRRNRFFIGGVIVGIFILVLAGGFLLYRQLNHPTHGTRTEFWTPALQAFTCSPILGKGPFTFISYYLQVNSVPTMVPYDYAHSIYMDLLSGTGILGLAAFAWLMVAVVKNFWGKIKDAEGEDWAVSVGALAALATFLVHGTVDSTHASEPLSLWNLCIVAGAALAVQGGQARQSMLKFGVKGGLALAAAGLTWFAWWTILPMKAGVDQADQGQWAAAAESFESAIQRDGGMAAAYQQAGLVESELAYNHKDGKNDKAIGNLAMAAQIDPYWGLNQANLAAMYRAAGRTKEALAAFEKAVKAAPRSDVFQLNLGAVREEIGDLAGAQTAYQAVLALNPDWREARFWRMTAFRQKVVLAWQAAHPAEPAKEISALQAMVEAQPESMPAYIALGRAYLKNGEVDSAERTIGMADFLTAGNTQLIERSWLQAEILVARGKYDQAVEIGEKMVKSATDYGVFGPGVSGNQIYEAYMFRRPVASLDFVPQIEVILWPDLWGRRALMLADWLDKVGRTGDAEAWRLKVAKNIPDLGKN